MVSCYQNFIETTRSACGNYKFGDDAFGLCDETHGRYRVCQQERVTGNFPELPYDGENGCALSGIFTTQDCANKVVELIEEGICADSGYFYTPLCAGDDRPAFPGCTCMTAEGDLPYFDPTSQANSVYRLTATSRTGRR